MTRHQYISQQIHSIRAWCKTCKRPVAKLVKNGKSYSCLGCRMGITQAIDVREA